MKFNSRDFDEFGFLVTNQHKPHRPKRSGRKKQSSGDEWGSDSRRKKDKPWRGKTNRRV